MKFGSVGAVIAAASKKDAVPLLKVGSIPIVRRIVLTLQQAGVFPIVVVTGTEALEVTHQVAPLGVVFIKNKECEKPELFSSVKLGLSYLQGKCDHVVFTPVNAPMFFCADAPYLDFQHSRYYNADLQWARRTSHRPAKRGYPADPCL